MAASLGPSWSLRSNASPRCLTAYVTKTDVASNPGAGSGGGGDSSNPFDDEATSSSSQPQHHGHGHVGASHHSQSQSQQQSTNNNAGYVYSVAFGTERGSLHYRNYPPSILDSDDLMHRDSSSSNINTSNRRAGYHHNHHERARDPSQIFIDPESTPDGQVNLQGAVKGAIVGIVPASLHSEVSSSPILSTTSAASLFDRTAATPTPVFLLLVDDNRGSASVQSSNPGAYAAHLVTVKHGAFNKLPAALAVDGNVMTPDKPPLSASHSHHRRGGTSSSGSGSTSGWFGGGGEHTPRDGNNPKSSTSQQYASSQNVSSNMQQSLGALPRMSCATYHPNTGFVYAAGTGVHGLPAPAVRAVLAGMMMVANSDHGQQQHTSGSSSGPFHHSSNASVSSSSHSIRQRHAAGSVGGPSNIMHHVVGNTKATQHQITTPPMALYLKTNHALPMPGVRCSSGGGSKNSMTLACSGRVAVVAVTNAFYAIPSFLDVNVIKASLDTGHPLSGSGGGASSGSVPTASLPNVTATKIVTFAQSSQVHPVIAMEVITSSSSDLFSSGVIVTSTTERSATSAPSNIARYLKPITSLVFLASGRECTTVEIVSIPDSRAVNMIGKGGSVVGGMVSTSIKSSAQKHGMATLPSPILAAAPLPPTRDVNGRNGNSGRGGDLSSGPLVALLTVDGLVHIRSPFCVAVPLASIEVGTRPNDFFSLSSLPCPKMNVRSRNIVATSYGGEARLVACHAETPQDFADRLIKLSIDAFGSNGFPRLELAEALGATFSATSYVGPMEPTVQKRTLLKQYLESVLGVDDGMRLASRFVVSQDGQESGLEVQAVNNEDEDKSREDMASTSLGPNPLLTCTALLCLVCYQLSPPNGTAACRASGACASAMGIVRPKDSGISKAAVAVCELVADRLLKEVSSSFSLLSASSVSAPITSSNRPSQGSASMEFVESAVWMLRSCGCHEKAINVLQERMNSPAFRNASAGIGTGIGGYAASSGGGGGAGGWSQIKFDSYLATHLGELWSSKDERCCQLVLLSSATRNLIARNPTLGLSVYTTVHPQNEMEWKRMKLADDPLSHPLYPSKVVELLKSITPQQSGVAHELGMAESFSSFTRSPRSGTALGPLPIDSGRALAVSYLESAIGIATGRPTSQNKLDTASSSSLFQPESRDELGERKADMHDELSYLLLEGVISERGDEDGGEDSDLGAVYRFKLRRLLSWPNSKIRSERLLGSLPSSFLREHALLLGRLGRHEDALQILYSQEKSLELALEYCDVRHERQQAQIEDAKARGGSAKPLPNECAYIPLVKVALSSDPDSDRGTAAAIQVLALRRDSIDKAAALRLLPKNIPMSAVVRPFLIPAVVENESQVRRLTVASSLLRSRYIQLKHKLTEAQLKSQSSLSALQRLNLGEPLHSSKPTKARPVHAASPYYPDVMLVKHFFSRHLVIQAQITNNATTATEQSSARTLSDVAFVIAESSDEALVPTMELPLKTVPPGATGSVWCVLAASPQRLDGAAFLTCELRFNVFEVDATTGTPLNFSEGANTANGFGRTYVEELQEQIINWPA